MTAAVAVVAAANIFYAKRARPFGRALLHIYDMYMYYSFTAVANASEPGPIWQDTLSDKWST